MSLETSIERRSAAWDFQPLAIVLGVVYWGSSLPPRSMPDSRIFEFDKLLHVAEYAVVGLALFWSGRRLGPLRRGRKPFPRLGGRLKLTLYILLGGALWAFSDEVHQALVGRDCSLGDMAADVLGLALAAALSLRGTLRRRNE